MRLDVHGCKSRHSEIVRATRTHNMEVTGQLQTQDVSK